VAKGSYAHQGLVDEHAEGPNVHFAVVGGQLPGLELAQRYDVRAGLRKDLCVKGG
jgi:hypothetical protein